jgi:hypothetical protein
MGERWVGSLATAGKHTYYTWFYFIRILAVTIHATTTYSEWLLIEMSRNPPRPSLTIATP